MHATVRKNAHSLLAEAYVYQYTKKSIGLRSLQLSIQPAMNMKHLLLRVTQGLLICAPTLLPANTPNILFIAVDDLKPTLSNYGDSITQTPNFDRLATHAVTFTNAHCQQAVCGPSRASVLTGLRPDQTKVWDLATRIRNELPDVITLPQHFKVNGYQTVGIGKIFDSRSVEGPILDDPESWSRFIQAPANPNEELGSLYPEIVAKVRAASSPATTHAEEMGLRRTIGGIPAYEGQYEVSDEAYLDGRIAKTAIDQLEELAAGESPFFLGVGFHKPHLPFIAPKQYWDLYQPSDFAPDPTRSMPDQAPGYHYQPGWELRNGNYADIPPLSSPEVIDDALATTLIHGYYACVSYIDAQLGKLLDTLKNSGAADNTIIVLWSDHGYHLGDHGIWCKHTNYEQATRSVLMIADLRGPKNASEYAHPVELLDIYPTLSQLAGINPPDDLAGSSLTPILNGSNTPIKTAAVSQFDRKFDGRKIIGYAWRSERYRYIEWIDRRFRKGDMSGPVVDVELYDYRIDPNETRNLAHEASHQEALYQMQQIAEAYKSAHGLQTSYAPKSQ